MVERSMRRFAFSSVFISLSFILIACATRPDLVIAPRIDFIYSASFAKFMEKGNILFNEGRYNEAIEIFNKAIKIEPYNALGYVILGQVHLRLNNIEEALRYTSLAMEKSFALASAYATMGNIFHFGLRDYERVLEYYDLAIWHNPYSDAHFFNRGQVHAKMGFNNMALQDFNAAVYLNPFYITIALPEVIFLPNWGNLSKH